MKILVTGANGYLGSGIVKEILDRGNDVIAADFKTDRVDDRAKKVECDLFNIEDPYNYFDKPDVLLHLAWRDGFVHYSDAHVDDLPNHYHFIKEMVKSSIERVAVMGSMHEVGFLKGALMRIHRVTQ
jgi:nucleoside-diphosphate-sugar epimerase